jgi:hypothetical protein
MNNYCPLCQGKISGEDTPPFFPTVPTIYEKYKLFFQILALSGIAIAIIAVTVNLILPQTGNWSLLVLLGIGCLWLSVGVSARNLHHVTLVIVNQSILGSLFFVLWDFVVGWKGWSIDYAVPILLMVSLLTMQILIKARGIKTEDYMVCTSFHAFVGLVPLVLFLTGALNQVIPTLICIALSALLLAGMLIFRWGELLEEYHKRFRI